jgi:hypothetical protein
MIKDRGQYNEPHTTKEQIFAKVLEHCELELASLKQKIIEFLR